MQVGAAVVMKQQLVAQQLGGARQTFGSFPECLLGFAETIFVSGEIPITTAVV